MSEWTKITPEQIEAIGFKDMYDEDAEGNGNGHLAEWVCKDTPYWITHLEMDFLASHWQLSITDAQEGEKCFEIVTEDDFNKVMNEFSIGLKL